MCQNPLDHFYVTHNVRPSEMILVFMKNLGKTKIPYFIHVSPIKMTEQIISSKEGRLIRQLSSNTKATLHPRSFLIGTPNSTECTQLLLARRRLHCILQSAKKGGGRGGSPIDYDDLDCLAASCTMHAKIDSWGIVGYLYNLWC